jgi:hypothetical protein
MLSEVILRAVNALPLSADGLPRVADFPALMSMVGVRAAALRGSPLDAAPLVM